MPREPQSYGRAEAGLLTPPPSRGAFPVMMQTEVCNQWHDAPQCDTEGVTAAGTVQDSHLIPF